MGGYGSGPYGHMGTKRAKTGTNSCYSLDIRSFDWQHLIPGVGLTCSWGGNPPKVSIRIKMLSADTMRLDYSSTIDGVTEPVETFINLGSSPCNYGNRRMWFHCPRCQRRVALLYLKGHYFRCRHCHNLNYYSSQEYGNFNDMSMRRVNKVLRKLKSDERCSFDILYHTPSRPRYMHRKTYGRLLRQYDRKRNEYAASVRAKLESFGSDARKYIDLPDGF